MSEKPFHNLDVWMHLTDGTTQLGFVGADDGWRVYHEDDVALVLRLYNHKNLALELRLEDPFCKAVFRVRRVDDENVQSWERIAQSG